MCCGELCWGSHLLRGGCVGALVYCGEFLGLSSAAGSCVGALICCGELCCSRVLRESAGGVFWGSHLLRGVVLGLSSAAGSFGAPGMNPGNEMHLQPFSLASRKTRSWRGAIF